MMTNTIGGLTANNAAYNWMSSANSLRALSFRGGNGASLLSSERSLKSGMLNYSVNYQAGLLMEETAQKLKKDNIKRTFDIFG